MPLSAFLPRRRPMFGHRKTDPAAPAVTGPTSDERRLIERIIRHSGPRPPQ
ncbi:hypothetical protein JI743_13290 [Sphingopyxis sp. DHUNG17]|nr:hypothetical protein [Sphingopyxis lutea]